MKDLMGSLMEAKINIRKTRMRPRIVIIEGEIISKKIMIKIIGIKKEEEEKKTRNRRLSWSIFSL